MVLWMSVRIWEVSGIGLQVGSWYTGKHSTDLSSKRIQHSGGYLLASSVMLDR
jgi:hypothetical protein